jgi:plasmid stabilization system protein ParE
MSRAIVFRRSVGRDLAAAYAWYEKQSAGLGERLLVDANASFDTIEEFPEVFAPLYGEVRRTLLSRYPYAVFYRVEPRQIVILAFLHTARDPELWPKPRKKK